MSGSRYKATRESARTRRHDFAALRRRGGGRQAEAVRFEGSGRVRLKARNLERKPFTGCADGGAKAPGLFIWRLVGVSSLVHNCCMGNRHLLLLNTDRLKRSLCVARLYPAFYGIRYSGRTSLVHRPGYQKAIAPKPDRPVGNLLNYYLRGLRRVAPIIRSRSQYGCQGLGCRYVGGNRRRCGNRLCYSSTVTQVSVRDTPSIFWILATIRSPMALKLLASM